MLPLYVNLSRISFGRTLHEHNPNIALDIDIDKMKCRLNSLYIIILP